VDESLTAVRLPLRVVDVRKRTPKRELAGRRRAFRWLAG
jgi:hypothetical protein